MANPRVACQGCGTMTNSHSSKNIPLCNGCVGKLMSTTLVKSELLVLIDKCLEAGVFVKKEESNRQRKRREFEERFLLDIRDYSLRNKIKDGENLAISRCNLIADSFIVFRRDNVRYRYHDVTSTALYGAAYALQFSMSGQAGISSIQQFVHYYAGGRLPIPGTAIASPALSTQAIEARTLIEKTLQAYFSAQGVELTFKRRVFE